MMGGLQRADRLDDLGHLVHSVDALLRVCGMAGLTEGLHHDLSAASLSHLQVQGGRLADHHVVRLHGCADLSGRHALEALLVHHACDVELAGEILVRVRREVGRRADEGCHRTLHIAGSAPVDLSVVDLSGEGRVLPLGLIRHRNGVDVAVKEQLLARSLSLDAADHVAVLVDRHGIKSQLGEFLLQDTGHAVLMSGIALLLDQLLAKLYNLVFSLFCQHIFFLLISRWGIFRPRQSPCSSLYPYLPRC